jgi:hypothetical protein
MRWAVRVELNKNHAGTNSSERRSATALAVCRATWWAQREREREREREIQDIQSDKNTEY